jgi:hypothetical protein
MSRSSVSTRALVIGIACCGLLAVVALASRGDHPSSGGGAGGRTLPASFLDYVFTFSLIVGLGMIVALAYYRAQLQKQTGRGGWEIRQMMLFLLAVASVSLLAVFWAERLRDDGARPLASVNVNTATGGATDTAGKGAPQREPEFRWEALLVSASLAVAVAGGFWLTRRGRRGAADARTLRDDLAAILQDTLDKLWDEEDPRRAVILAYAWMERTLAAHGLPRAPSEAPLEYLARVLVDLDASRESVFELTTLFERARFSPHVIDDEMKHDAIAALSAVRDELQALEPAA